MAPLEKTERENASAALRRAGRAQRKPCGGSAGKEGKGKRARSTSQSRPPAAEHGAEGARRSSGGATPGHARAIQKIEMLSS